MRLGAWAPFPQATALLPHFTHTRVSEPTLRRKTEQAGAAYVAVQTAAVEGTPRRRPPARRCSRSAWTEPWRRWWARGMWAEVKTLAIGTAQPPVREDGELVVHTTDLCYFSRLADRETFTRLALVETHRRGVATAGRVAGVADGAVGARGFLDYHRPDAARILDWRHAAQYLAAVAAALFAGEAARQWLDTQLRELLEGEPAVVLGKLRGLRDELAAQAGAAAPARLEAVEARLHYLEARRAQLRYADFRAAGYPLGSGVIESANKLVVEARLKWAGMHWAPAHVDAMLTLRNIDCNDRWDAAWPRIRAQLRRQATMQAAANHPWRRYGQPASPARQREAAATVN